MESVTRLKWAFATVLALTLLSAEAHAEKLIAVLPLDTRMTKGKMDAAAQSSLEEMLRDVATNLLSPGGWTVLTGENTLQVLVDNGVDPTKCGDQNCHLSMAREIKAERFLSGTIQYVDGEFTASIRLIDTRTGRILASERLTGKTTKVLRETFEPRAEQFFFRAGLFESSLHGPTAKAPREEVTAERTPTPRAEPASPTSARKDRWTLSDVGLDATAMDRSVDPCTDFYQYACGGWLKNTQVPADKSRWSRSFNEIRERNRDVLHDILEQARRSERTDPVSRKLGQFYDSCMNEASIEAAGLNPIEPLMKTARSVKDRPTLLKALFEFHKYNVPVLFDIGSGQDSKDATKMIALLDQAGLGLPDRDYYVNEGERERNLRSTYLSHVERILVLAGDKPADATKAAEEILSLETQIARLSQTRVERRDPNKTYNKLDLAGLKKAAPGFPWDDYFKALQHGDITEISVNSVPFFEGISKLVGSSSISAWQSYLRWHALHTFGSALPADFENETFALKRALTGQERLEDRWKRCVDSTDNALGELLGQAFVASSFASQSKADTLHMVSEISSAFSRNLNQLSWLDEETRRRVEEKRRAVSFLIGYPDRWKEYDWTVTPKAYASNLLASRQYELQRQLKKVGKPVDRGEWYMTPPTVNAYYDPQKNQLVFPAGILQPPFYNVKSSVAVNMGGMGMVVGHELTHAFDDEGSQFDAQGNLRSWWDPSVAKRFEEKGMCVQEQYSKYEAVAGVPLNGQLTAGENIADNGGVKLAFAAYRNIRKTAAEPILADGFSEDQQFFLAVGQAWCSLARPEEAARLAKIDPHAPPKWRVNGTLSNMPEFAAAFSCKYGSPMRPSNQCSVW
jgi:putative endopeptidase